MKDRSTRNLFRLDEPLVAISFLVLLVCLFYTLAYVFLVPYPGIDLSPGAVGWVVVRMDLCDAHPGWCETNPGRLQVGDQLITLGDLLYEHYRLDRRQVRFSGYGPGDLVPVSLIRAGERQAIQWLMPTVTPANRIERLSSLLFYLPFWLAGTAVLLLLRPRNDRWRLLISFNYLTAIWLAAGMVSSSQVAASSLVLHALSWLLVPVYLHLHILVPTPLLKKPSRYLMIPAYVLATTLAMLELFQLLPYSVYSLGVLLALGGSLGLLIYRLFDKSSPSVQLAARLMLVGVGLAFGPALTLMIIPNLLNSPISSTLVTKISILALPTLPLFYTYAIYKRYLGDLEFRANRLLGGYAFLLLYATTFAVIFSFSKWWVTSSESTFYIGLAATLVFVVSAPALRTRFQMLVDRLAYGGKHNPDAVLSILARQLPVTVERESLVQLLSSEIVPSLLIRQSGMVLLGRGDVEHLYTQGIGSHGVPESPQQVERLLVSAGEYRPPEAQTTEARDTNPNGDRFDWVRLAIPLISRQHSIGVWLLGRRDPDDYYPQCDIELLTNLANQVAVALDNSHLFQAERAAREQAETLREVSGALTASLDHDQVLDNILIYLERVIPYDSAAVVLAEKGSLQVVSGRGFPNPDLVLGSEHSADNQLSRQLLHTSHSLILSDAQADPRFESWGSTDYIRGWMGVPLIVQGEAIGYLTLDSKQVAAFNEKDALMAQAFANQAAKALENAWLFDQVKAGRKRLHTLSHRALNIQEAERHRIALELHDQIGQSLTAVKLNLQIAQQIAKMPSLVQHLDQSVAIVECTLQQVRDLALDLHPPMLDELGLPAALRWYVDRQAQQAGFSIELIAEAFDVRPSPDIEMACFRVTQEALTNIVRHAQAQRVRVELRQRNTELQVLIHDDGVGFDVPAALERATRGESLGVLSMRERIEFVGGIFKIDSTPGRGTMLRIRIPLTSPRYLERRKRGSE